MPEVLLGLAVMASVMGSVGADSRPLTGSLDGDHLVVQLDRGVRCSGTLDRMEKTGGLGNLHCSDGRVGSFEWTIVSPGHAVGDGSLDGEPLQLTIDQVGNTPQV